jgi:hypothetical protein
MKCPTCGQTLPAVRAWSLSEIHNRDVHKDVELSNELTNQVAPLFFGKAPGVQGLTLIDLVGMWLSGHSLELRKPCWETFCEGVKLMVQDIDGTKGT